MYMRPRQTRYDGKDKYSTPGFSQAKNYKEHFFPELIQRWFGDDASLDAELGAGSYGSVLKMSLTKEMKDRFRLKFGHRMNDRVGHISDIPIHTPVAIKVMLLKNSKMSYAMALREMSIQYELRHHEPVLIDDKHFGIRHYVPTLYFAGIDPASRACILVMHAIEGKTLYEKMSQDGMISPNLAVQFEHALLSMWLSGYFHLDLHTNNIFYDKEKRLKFIDFAVAVKIPDELVSRLKEYLRGNVPGVAPEHTIQAFWQDVGQEFADKVIASRHQNLDSPDQYYSNYDTWQYLERFISRPEEIYALRRKWWIPTPCDQLKDPSRTQREICARKKLPGFFSVFGGH